MGNMYEDWGVFDSAVTYHHVAFVLLFSLQEATTYTSSVVCGGHERVIPIETTVQELDMKEEGEYHVILLEKNNGNVQTKKETL